MTNPTPQPATSASRHLTVRGRQVHLRTWGDPEAPPLLLLHGAMDSSAPFQFVVDHLPAGRHYVAPDWCGGGRSDPAWCHWYPDFVADLDGIAEQLSPEQPVDLVGHSRGGNVACLYAGARPERVRRLMTVEGIGYSYASGDPDEGIATFAGWLAEQRNRRAPRPYESMEKLAESLARNNPGLTAEQTAFIAREWNVPVEGGGLRLATAFFPREKEGVPVSLPQAMAYWKRITAPVCYVYGERSHFTRRTVEQPDDFARRKACFAHWREVLIPGAGHMVQYDQPRLLAGAIREFFRLGAGQGPDPLSRTQEP
jgi:pimeloyl-ACP methyl ester carboxylesterase